MKQYQPKSLKKETVKEEPLSIDSVNSILQSSDIREDALKSIKSEKGFSPFKFKKTIDNLKDNKSVEAFDVHSVEGLKHGLGRESTKEE